MAIKNDNGREPGKQPNKQPGPFPMKKKQDLTVIKSKQIETETLHKYLETVGHDLPVAVTTQFLEICSVFNLNPFLREAYLVGYNQKQQSGPPIKKYNIIVGFEVYLKRAERSDRLNGWKAGTKTIDGEVFGYVEIYRKDWSEPFYLQVRMKEYAQQNRMWKTKPHTMIEKVAISQGFRRCFPNELAGIPYTQEEMSHAEPLQEAPTPQNPEPAPVAKKPAAPKENIVDVEPEPMSGDKGAPPDRGDIIQSINQAKTVESLRDVWREMQPIWTSIFSKESEDREVIETVFGKKKDALIKKEEKMVSK